MSVNNSGMNNDIFKGNWAEIKGKIKSKWGKLTEDEIETLKGNLDQITGKIQKAYGYAKEQAETEYQSFKQSLAAKANSAIDNNIKTAGATDSSSPKTNVLNRKQD